MLSLLLTAWWSTCWKRGAPSEAKTDKGLHPFWLPGSISCFLEVADETPLWGLGTSRGAFYGPCLTSFQDNKTLQLRFTLIVENKKVQEFREKSPTGFKVMRTRVFVFFLSPSSLSLWGEMIGSTLSRLASLLLKYWEHKEDSSFLELLVSWSPSTNKLLRFAVKGWRSRNLPVIWHPGEKGHERRRNCLFFSQNTVLNVLFVFEKNKML